MPIFDFVKKAANPTNQRSLLQTLAQAVSQEQKKHTALLFIRNPELSNELLKVCFDKEDHLSGKAFRMLELICLNDLNFLVPHIDLFLFNINTLTKDNEIRPAAKICERLVIAYYNDSKNDLSKYLKKHHRQKITEVCFDWLLGNQKVACQAYAMTSLQQLGKEFKWVHLELKTILIQNYNTGSPGYKARARMVLKKLGE